GKKGPPVSSSSGAIIRNNVIHDIAACPDSGTGDCSCIKTGGPQSNFTITGNICYNAGMGIWSDSGSGDPNDGWTPHTVTNNIVHDITEYCYHLEARSSWIFRNNIGYNCPVAFFSRQGGQIRGAKIQNNTFYNYTDGCMLFNHNDTGDNLTALRVENNICFSGSPGFFALTLGSESTSDATNIFRNNLFFHSGNNNGICWAQGVTLGGLGCNSPGATYADTSAGISSWQSACSGPTCSGNITGNPLFAAAASGDFRLCTASGQPVAAC